VIKVKISVDRDKREATVDFTGTSDAEAEQLQRARTGGPRGRALLFRVMVEADIPMNAGCLKPIRIVIPEGCMLRRPIRRRRGRQCRDSASMSPTPSSARSARWPTARAR
jgi:N-methylhydantoinase B/oxoprolinase/acetone carboxylase alpha subunit